MTTPYEFRSIELHLIDVPANRLRGIKTHRVETLAKDIAAQGQLQPIILTEEKHGRFTLVKGLQRLEALKVNKRDTIDARVTPAAWLKDRESRLHEIMATLNREDFTKLERASALAELKEVYEAIYPQTKNGGDRKTQAAKNARENQNEIFAFSKIAADAAGLSERSIQLAVSIWNGLALVTRARVRGSWLENDQSNLLALSKISPNLQGAILDLLLSDPPEASSVAEAEMLAQGKKPADPAEKAFRAVVDKWKRFPIGHKRHFVSTYREEILRILEEEGAI